MSSEHISEDDLDHGFSTNRIEALSDGIFAIAMTLLVLDLTVPTNLSNPQIAGSLYALLPHLITFFLSFAALGVFWVGQQNQFHWIKHSDRRLLWLNLLYLSFVVLIPFSTSFLATYPSSLAVFFVYALNLLLCASSLLVAWMYVNSKPLLTHGKLDQVVVDSMTGRMNLLQALTIVSMAASLVSVYAAIGVLVLGFLWATRVTMVEKIIFAKH
jgi:uncharacterized membrane protein